MITASQTPELAKRKIPRSIRQPLKELNLALKNLLGPELEKVILFGSYARGEAQPPDSDLDILLIMHDGFDYWQTDRQVSPLFAEISLKHDVVISRKIVSHSHFANSQMPFVINVRREGIAV